MLQFKVTKCQALWSLIVFDPNYDSTIYNIVTVFNGRFFEAQSMERRFFEVFGLFLQPIVNLVHIILKIVVLEIRVLMLFLERNCTAALCIFSLRLVKSLQFRGRRKIAESHKYCLVCEYFSLAYIFSLFLHLTDLGIS